MPIMQADRRGFTLVECLVTLILLAVLAMVGVVFIMHARAADRAALCRARQARLSDALFTFYNVHRRFPSDDPAHDLAIDLQEVLSWPGPLHELALPKAYLCPNAPGGNLTNSYEPYYVRRRRPTGEPNFVVGCPRHGRADHACINRMGLGRSLVADAGRITINGTPVHPADPSQKRMARAGEIRFEDGTHLRAAPDSDDFAIETIQSFRDASGALYSLIRLHGSGRAECSVAAGSRLEIVAPEALIECRGGEFTVQNDARRITVSRSAGLIEVWDRAADTIRFATDSKPIEIIPPAQTAANDRCVRCPVHCCDGAHCPRCPLHGDPMPMPSLRAGATQPIEDEAPSGGS